MKETIRVKAGAKDYLIEVEHEDTIGFLKDKLLDNLKKDGKTDLTKDQLALITPWHFPTGGSLKNDEKLSQTVIIKESYHFCHLRINEPKKVDEKKRGIQSHSLFYSDSDSSDDERKVARPPAPDGDSSDDELENDFVLPIMTTMPSPRRL